MAKQLIKGNEAITKAAILAGCEAYYGYPITPASEIAESSAKYYPLVGRTFLQAESEVAAIQMVYGAASAGVRVMTASSSPGISLKQEGVSYCAGSELPVVIVDIVRGGPGLGNIAPEQGDYNQIVKGGGHGCYKTIVLSPNSCQEMCDLTILAFELAEKYRNPVYVMTDGTIGQMMEPVEFPEKVIRPKRPDWRVGCTEDTKNLICSIFIEPDELEEYNLKLQRKYKKMEENELRYEAYKTHDAEIVLVGYGIISRIQKSVVNMLREEGIKAGLLRPITLFPFPSKQLRDLREQVSAYFVTELSDGQMIDDVRLAVGEAKPVHLYTRMGGMVPTIDEVYNHIKEKL